MRYAVIYKNRPTMKGLDEFFVDNYTTSPSLDKAMKFDVAEVAIMTALGRPTIDGSHLPAQVVEVYEKPVQVEYSLGKTL